MVNIIWKPVGTGLYTTRMVCVMCRTDQRRNFTHEVACKVMSKRHFTDNVEQESVHAGDSDEISDNEYDEENGNADILSAPRIGEPGPNKVDRNPTEAVRSEDLQNEILADQSGKQNENQIYGDDDENNCVDGPEYSAESVAETDIRPTARRRPCLLQEYD